MIGRKIALAALATMITQAGVAYAQDRLRTMPGYERYQRMQPQIQGSVKLGRATSFWSDDGKWFEYQADSVWYRYDVAGKKVVSILTPTRPAAIAFGRRGGGGGRRGGGGGPERGRQFESTISPDSMRRAFYRDRNLFISDTAGQNIFPVTTDGNAQARTKNGSASWVYGEELGQNTAFWWSPSGSKIAYYRFDESKVPDYYLALGQNDLQSRLDVEAYPKAGVTNPTVQLFVYDVASRRTVEVDIRDGKPFADSVVGHYVYAVGWSQDGSEILMNRTNRRQNIMELAACSPESGSCRAVVREEWLPSWVSNRPTIRWLADGRRFIWESERNGYSNLLLYDLSGKELATLTNHQFEVGNIVRVDEKANALFYTARDGDNHLKMQLHRVGLDGKNHRRLTDPAFNHTVTMSPDGKYFVDVAETHEHAPVTTLRDMEGKAVTELARSDMTKFQALGLRRTEMFTYKAADGVTTLRGMITFPSDFDPNRRYPTLVPVYGGPASGSNTSRETFATPNPLTEYGFLVVNLDSRAAPGMGKRTLDAIYMKLGQVEMDDMAAGIKSLWDRPYFDKDRVGIYGTSYGGYTAAMQILRHPDVFAAACASSPVTDWRNYDTIYTERYMWIPQENKSGYDMGSAMTYADSLRGRLLLYYGTADNNVHPANSLQLIRALQRANKSFEVQVGPDAGHTAVNQQRMMEFFIESLMLKPMQGAVTGSN